VTFDELLARTLTAFVNPGVLVILALAIVTSR
jgi:hypothetical protein